MKRISNATRCAFVIFLILSTPLLLSRHPFRTPNPDFPVITVSWNDHTEQHSIQTPYVRLHPLFTFKTEDFYDDLLPEAISYRDDPTQQIETDVLSQQIEYAVSELKTVQRKAKRSKELTHFYILQHKNFNYRKSCGLIVLRFKIYPLIVKLFIEHPASFLDLHATGIEPTFFFYMGGGANRHLSGFTRIKNRSILKKKINDLPQWKNAISIPRKWFWFPRDQKDIVLQGRNLAGHDCIETHIPSVYAVIADEIDLKKDTEDISRRFRSRVIMQLCNDLQMFIDPHEKNYVFTKDEQGQFKITIVDTEHFPTMVGILNEKNFKNHSNWYTYLAGKCFRDMYLQTKQDLFNAQEKLSTLALM